MVPWLGRIVRRAYERLLLREIDGVPTHVAIIQDGNRRYARERGRGPDAGHREGAETAKQVLEWCEELGIEELTLYAFSTENFARPADELEALFDLMAEKFREFADAERVHEAGVAIEPIGDLDRLPERVQAAARYAAEQTADYDDFRLNVAVAYGGRNELLGAARGVARAVDAGSLAPDSIDVAEIERRLYARPVRDVDLIIRTGGDERTSNFLPWHANGNEAAVFFCAPFWPSFSKVDFLRAIRTYESREASWRRTRAERAAALIRAVGELELEDARAAAARLRDHLPRSQAKAVVAELERREPDEQLAD
jgi:tritrans,polycis-undecaprenyl-diphosphate synthase [geranylgeranyl-diphosphate specific]